MNKKDLRKKYKELRSKLSEDEIDDLSMDIANNLLKMSIWEQSFYHVFLSIQNKREINTEFILHILQGKDKNIVVSKSNFENNTLEHILLTDGTILKVNSWGIPEPTDGIPIPEDKTQVVFIPLLAFDEKGNRIGYGKGFYDKFLAKCNPDTLKIGLSFFSPEKEIKEVLPTDIRLDYCVTPLNVYTFN
ncbi:5-formyltetrahydrofolate cyclo-ligase [Aquimarina sp. BL5]|uniref:5-formyltetrahydrofolate cyclo-ligase n=1 Tax=Aquimarina sp. BL5 TaxID=1714860 RepID=UPI000E47B373|nr:5-formyltetrahydrofolate cyclo-ligase [Aquimarina sp. BL5]AXT54090.1 5-formyltetrahydrofolate cyclo-ligase [Aquimarina sp. BL5]RKN07717.1 5-formyltetrahydrofolate cyclo-ligase [Aquimarina sp. BL5]